MIGLMMLAAAAAGGSYASQSFMSGDKLRDLCNRDKLTCATYVAGVADAINSLQEIGALPRLMCQPAPLTLGDVAVPVINFLETHPDIRGDAAGGLVWSSLIESYPCPKPSEPATAKR